MTWSSQLKGRAIGAFLSPTGQSVAAVLRHLGHGGLPGRGELELFHDPADPISHLLVQKLSQSGIKQGRLWVVGEPAADVNPAPEARRQWRHDDARRLLNHHGLTLGGSPAARPRCGEGSERVRAALAVPRGFGEHLTLAVRLGAALWGNGDLDDALDGLPTDARRDDDRLRARGFYAGGSIYWRGHWFQGLDRWDHFLAAREGRLPGAPKAPQQALSLRPEDRVVCYFSFRSPYSYVALERLFSICDRAGATLEVRPVLPMVMRGLAVPRIKRMFLVQDAAREARRHGVPFGRIADPLGAGVERCLAVFCAVHDRAQRHLFLRTAARGIWSEARDMANDTDLLWATQLAGIDRSTVQDALLDDTWRSRIEDNRQALLATGLWGVPSFTVRGQALWGQDRLLWLGG